jgi:hypothetical protein
MVSQSIRVGWRMSCDLIAVAVTCLVTGQVFAQLPRAPTTSERMPAAKTEGALQAEIEKLILLLDADRFEDRERASRRLAEIGLPALAALQEAQRERSSEARRRAGNLVHSLMHGPRLRELAAFAAVPDDKLDVERGMWHIARILEPDVKFDELARQLDDLALRVRQRLAGIEAAKANPQQVVTAMCGVLFLEDGFVGNFNNYHDPANSSLARVLATRKGLQITLSHVCLAVARRLDVPLVGIPASLNYIVKYDGTRAPAGYSKEDIYFHPYQRGKILTREDRRREFPTHDPDKMVPPDTSRQSLTRMLRNLITALSENRRTEQLKEAEEFLIFLTALEKEP